MQIEAVRPETQDQRLPRLQAAIEAMQIVTVRPETHGVAAATPLSRRVWVFADLPGGPSHERTYAYSVELNRVNITVTWHKSTLNAHSNAASTRTPASPEVSWHQVTLNAQAATDSPIVIQDEDTDQIVRGLEALPFFGMWADREEMANGAAWVRGERERWQGRLSRRD